MSSTLGQSTLNFPNENETTKGSSTDPLQMTVKNIANLPRNELEEFLKVRSNRCLERIHSFPFIFRNQEQRIFNRAMSISR